MGYKSRKLDRSITQTLYGESSRAIVPAKPILQDVAVNRASLTTGFKDYSKEMMLLLNGQAMSHDELPKNFAPLEVVLPWWGRPPASHVFDSLLSL
ncbi:hypothetical protein C4D60_Mb05t01110 [Musa balbisiana]|uniref:Uncharacterized protein n=1 Tax=Musa balbisiana TaxID=52838 RepID=A0A4V4H7U5_MUSBA|nr:hypothetical protein C4D60_Mb05t01110 [Musa balbisiana]